MKSKEQLIAEEFQIRPTTIPDSDFRRVVEEVKIGDSPAAIGKIAYELTQAFRDNANNRPPAKTPIPNGQSFGNLNEKYEETSDSLFIYTSQVIALTNDKETYTAVLRSKRLKGSDDFITGYARFTHKYWWPARGVELKGDFEGKEAIEKTRELFDRHKLTVPYVKPKSVF